MWKKIFLLLTLVMMLVACNSNKKEPSLTVEEVNEEKSIDYDLEKIVLSKGFTTTDPNVEVTRKGKNLRLLITAGLMESSGVNIDNITKKNNTINIYLSRMMEKDKIQLSVPQITLLIDSAIATKAEDLKFNIIPQNYETISLKFNKNQILDKIYTEFKIEPSTIPEVELSKIDDNILWNIYFTNLLNKNNAKSPLFNLFVKADALTGEILDSKQYTTSTYIDKGQQLDYMPNKFLVYRQEHTEGNINYESLWSYNLNTNEKSKLYTTKYKIKCASISPDGEYIALIEIDDEQSDIYLIRRSEKIAYKITPINYLHPKLVKWKDNNTLCFIDVNKGVSTLFVYDILQNKSINKLHIDKIIESFDIVDEKLIFTEYDELDLNKNIYITEDGINLKQIGTGYKPSVIGSNKLIYMENLEKENKNVLKIYDIENNTYLGSLENNIANYYKIDNENLLLVEKVNSSNQYNLAKYNVNDKSLLHFSKINTDHLFYNSDEQKAYISLAISADKNKSVSNIYCIDLSKLNLPKN